MNTGPMGRPLAGRGFIVLLLRIPLICLRLPQQLRQLRRHLENIAERAETSGVSYFAQISGRTKADSAARRGR
jgi:hypothetical protein